MAVGQLWSIMPRRPKAKGSGGAPVGPGQLVRMHMHSAGYAFLCSLSPSFLSSITYTQADLSLSLSLYRCLCSLQCSPPLSLLRFVPFSHPSPDPHIIGVGATIKARASCRFWACHQTLGVPHLSRALSFVHISIRSFIRPLTTHAHSLNTARTAASHS